jgi:Ca2+-binding RTX toxin-like protein
MDGGSGNDLISDGGGADVLIGGIGNDTLNGGAAADQLTGGLGADVFDFNLTSDSTNVNRDRIVGFDGAGAAAGDLIDLSGIDANTAVAGNQAFGFGQISIINSGAITVVRANVNASPAFEFVLEIEDGATLASAYTAADFIL